MANVKDGRRDANDFGNDGLANLMSHCANCNLELVNGVAAISEIFGKSPTNIDHRHEMLQEEKSTSYAVTVLEALSKIYGFPLERRRKQDERMWRKEDECVLCKQCAKIITMFYHAYQELKMLAHEASYIYKGLEQIRNCVRKTFSDDDGEDNAAKFSRNVKNHNSNNKKTYGDSDERAISIISSRESPSKSLENDKTELEPVQVQSIENDRTEEIRIQNIDETPFELDIVKVETLLSEQCEKDTNIKSKKSEIEVPCTQEKETEIGTRERVSADGRLIRSSTRTRKIKTPIDFGSSPSSTRRNSLLTKNTCGRRRSTRIGENIEQQKSIIKEPAASSTSSSTNVPPTNTSDDMDSVLWEFCNEIYYKDTNLATLKDGRFICPDVKCGKSFKGLKTLNKHSLVHDLKRTYRCSKCDKGFINRQEIKLHVQQSHMQTEIPNNPNTYSEECLLNSKQNTASTSASSKQLKRKDEKSLVIPEEENEAYLKAEKQYQCEHCDKVYISKRMYEKHLTFHNKQGVMCRCTVCDQTFHTALNLARHITTVHDANNDESLFDKDLEPGEIKPKDANSGSFFSCNKCQKTFKRKHQLNVHDLFHNETIPRFGCSKCPKKFFQPNSLRTHMLVHSMKNPMLCKKCDKVFERRDHFKRHMEVVHNKNRIKKATNSAHTCSDCKKTFSRKEYLRLHMRIHTGEKPHVCEVCGKQFRDPRNLVQHLVTHKTERPFCCSVCGLTFKRAHHLNDHEGTHRQNIVRPFVCPVEHCGKAFKLRKHLASHELVHLGSKDHTCHVCGRAFSRKDNLRQHINKIHGKKLADELLIVVQEQRERHRQTQQKQQRSALNVEDAESSEECIFEQDTILADTTTLADFSTSLEQETAVIGASSNVDNFIGENGQISQVLQIPTDLVTTIAVPVSSIVATLAPTNSFPNFSYI